MPHPNLNIARTLITSYSRSYNSAQLHALSHSINFQQAPYSFNPSVANPTADCSSNVGCLLLLRQFQASGSDPDEFAISKALSVLANLNALDEGTHIHAFLLKKNAPMDVAATNSLINLYFKCGRVDDADKVFYEMPERDVYTWTAMVSGYVLNGMMNLAVDSFEMMPKRTTVSWNSLINGYQMHGHDEVALQLFCRMRQLGEPPNKVTFIAVLKACAGLCRSFGVGMLVHCLLVKSSWISNVIVACTLMDTYAKHGNMLASCKMFEEIRNHSVVSWSMLLSGFAINGNVADAEGIFEQMPEKNVVSWNVMITSYVQSGMQDRALRLLVDMMEEGMKPNCFTMTSLLSGCSTACNAEQGKLLHGYVIKVGLESDPTVSNSLITMYGELCEIGNARLVFEALRCHDVVSWTAMVSAYINVDGVDEARHVFDMMPEKNLISWNTMMSGYLQDKKCPEPNSVDDALTFFYEMERSNIKPDHFSYNCALTACGRSEALEQARAIHCRVVRRGFESDVGVGNALITVYGRCGCLGEADKCFSDMNHPDMISWNALLTCYSQNGRGNEVLNFYEEMQNSGVKPNHVTFISLLSACSYMGEVKKGQEIFNRMETDHGISPSKEHYTCMVDLLGRAGLLHEAEALIKKMPVEPDATLWGALLGACKMHGDAALAKKAAEQIFRLEPNNSGAHIALAEAYAAAKMWEDVARVRAMIKGRMLMKEPGCSWIDVRNQKHVFLSGDHRLIHNNFVHEGLSTLYSNMMDEDHVSDCESWT